MNRGAIRAFARLIKRLSCRQLRSLLKKLSRRLKIASTGGAFALIFKTETYQIFENKDKNGKSQNKS